MNESVKAMQGIDLKGNIIPHQWFNTIKKSNGAVDLVAIVTLSEIVYWYRPSYQFNESGMMVGIKQKFDGDTLQKSYDDLSEKLGLTKRQVREAVVRLEEMELVKREFRNIVVRGTHLSNVLFIHLNVDKLKEITLVYDNKKLEVSHSGGTPMTEKSHTYTKSTSKSTSNINNIVSDEPIPNHSKGNQQKKSDQPNKVNHSNDIDTIITYLNDKTGKRYSSKSSGNKRIIQARLNEGYTLDDFKRVIDHKCNEWLPPVKFSNGKMSDTYLRPATLFNQKFDQYLNESPDVEVKPKTDKPSTFQGYF